MIEKVSTKDQEWRDMSHGERFQHGRKSLTGMDNEAGIGCALFKVAPGKRAFPSHAHLANDEALFVLEGEGTLTVGDEDIRMGAGDFVMIPRGSSTPHVLVSEGEADLIYICMSTMNTPDVVHYPDSDKLGVLEEKFPFGPKGLGKVGGIYARNQLGYWDGED